MPRRVGRYEPVGPCRRGREWKHIVEGVFAVIFDMFFELCVLRRTTHDRRWSTDDTHDDVRIGT